MSSNFKGFALQSIVDISGKQAACQPRNVSMTLTSSDEMLASKELSMNDSMHINTKAEKYLIYIHDECSSSKESQSDNSSMDVSFGQEEEGIDIAESEGIRTDDDEYESDFIASESTPTVYDTSDCEIEGVHTKRQKKKRRRLIQESSDDEEEAWFTQLSSDPFLISENKKEEIYGTKVADVFLV